MFDKLTLLSDCNNNSFGFYPQIAIPLGSKLSFNEMPEFVGSDFIGMNSVN